jgi:glycosyltransferase involved in cell wall biosynthesis
MDMNRGPRILVIQNIITSYKTALFNELTKLLEGLEVAFIGATEKRREWTVDRSNIHYSYTLLFNDAIDSVKQLTIFKETWRLLDRKQPDILILVGDYSNLFGWAGMLWGRKNRKKMGFWFDSTYADHKRYWYLEGVKKIFLLPFEFGITPGVKSKHYLETLGMDGSDIFTTGYAVDNNFYLDKYRIHKENKDHLIEELNVSNRNFLFVGRFSREKNIISLLKAYKKIKENKSEWGLILVGDGPEKNAISEFIRQHKLEDHIHLPGFIQQSEITKYYTVSDVMILPSVSEPWGLVINEAMICELPLIVSDRCGCHPELVKDAVNGFVYPAPDNEKLEKCMRYMIDNEEKLIEMGIESSNIIKNHAPETVADRITRGISKYIDL